MIESFHTVITGYTFRRFQPIHVKYFDIAGTPGPEFPVKIHLFKQFEAIEAATRDRIKVGRVSATDT